MNPNDSLDDLALSALMESLPMSKTTPDNLKSKLIDLAATSVPVRRAARRPILAIALSAATLVAAIAIVTSVPATAKSWGGIMSAVHKVQRMELVVSDPRTNQVRNVARMDEKSIYVHLSEGDAMYVTDRLVRTYDKSDNLVMDVVMPEKGPHPDVRADVWKELSMSTILAQYEEKYGTRYMEIGPVHESKGRRIYEVTLREPNSLSYGKLVVDATTDLPISVEAFEPENGRAVKKLEMSARFNELATRPSPIVPPPGSRLETVPVEKLIEKNHGEMPKLNFSFRRLLAG